jgi:branched-chain amino acid transport system substrate-binding protein
MTNRAMASRVSWRMLTLASLAGCGGGQLTSGKPTGPTTNTVKIGVFLQSGGDGSDEVLATREINEAGGITIGDAVYSIDLVRTLMGETPESGVAAVTSMVSRGVVAAVGPRWSSITLGARPDHSDGAAAAAIAAHLLLVSGSASAAAISTLADDDLVWRTVPSDDLQGRLAASAASSRLHAKTASILFRDDAWGKGLAATFTAVFEAGGGHVLASKPYDPTVALNSYAFPELDAVFKDKPDVVYLPSFDEIAQIGNRVVQGDYLQPYGSSPPSFLAADGALSDNLLTNAPAAMLAHLLGTTPSPVPGNPNFQKYVAANAAAGFAAPEGNSANLYDAVYCIALAIQASGSLNADDFKKAMRAISRDDGGDTTIGVGQWPQAKAALASGAGIDYQGASGPIDFTPEGDPGRGRIALWTVVDDGRGGFAFDLSKGASYVVNADGSASFQ